ncbi:MAG TPA: hypothetical protein DEA84_03615, partial [Erwinia persicina]|nr:hypothetical protein [Erwinia persicina]HBT52571.1 hypothetical protein [Erwinia persicina]
KAKPNHLPDFPLVPLFSSLVFCTSSLRMIILKQIFLRFIPRIYLIIKIPLYFKAFADPSRQRQCGCFTLK